MRREQFEEVVRRDDDPERAGHQGDKVRLVRRAEDQLREPRPAEIQHAAGDRGQAEHGHGGPTDQRPQVPLLAVVFQIPPKATRQGQHRQRRGQHQKAEGHVPLAQFLRRQPPAKKHRPAESHQPLNHRERQQDDHAVGQRVAAEPRRRAEFVALVRREQDDRFVRFQGVQRADTFQNRAGDATCNYPSNSAASKPAGAKRPAKRRRRDPSHSGYDATLSIDRRRSGRQDAGGAPFPDGVAGGDCRTRRVSPDSFAAGRTSCLGSTYFDLWPLWRR